MFTEQEKTCALCGTGIATEAAEKVKAEYEDRIADLEFKIEELESELSDAQSTVDDRDREIEKLQSQLADLEIDCGIGKICYQEPDNLRLSQFMSNLATQIQEHGLESVHI